MIYTLFSSWGPLAGPHNVGDFRFYYTCGDIWSTQCNINMNTHIHTHTHTH